MAESTTKTPKKTFKNRVQQLPKPPEEPAEPAATSPAEDPDAPETPPPAAKRGRPPKSDNVVPRSMTFFERLAKIEPQDWGTRAKVKVYRLAPVINRLVNADHKFVCIYGTPGDPPLTEEQLKVDHGSGKYRLYLNYKAPAAPDEKELDRVEIDILDPAFPPKIPPGEWMDDPRNRQWAWAKPKEPAPAAAPVPGASISDMADVFRVANDLRREIREEMTPPPTVTPTAPPVSPPPPGPDIASQIGAIFDVATKVNQMRTENPMVDILKDELAALRGELAEQRKERETALKAKLAELERKLETPIAAKAEPNALADKIMNMAIDKFLGNINNPAEVVTTVTRSKLPPWLEVAKDLVPQVINSPLLVGIGTRLMNPNPTPIMRQAPPPGAPNGQPAAPTVDEFMQFVKYGAMPAMLSYLKTDEATGEDFAQWMGAGHEEWLPRIQKLTHSSMPGAIGTPVIVQFFKLGPGIQWWPQIMAACNGDESKFIRFVTDFCQWHPEPPEGTEPAIAPGTSGTPEASQAEDSEVERIEV